MTQTQLEYQKLSENARHNLAMEQIGESEARAKESQALMNELSTRLEIGDKWTWQRLVDQEKLANDRWKADVSAIDAALRFISGMSGATARLIG